MKKIHTHQLRIWLCHNADQKSSYKYRYRLNEILTDLWTGISLSGYYGDAKSVPNGRRRRYITTRDILIRRLNRMCDRINNERQKKFESTLTNYVVLFCQS